MGRKSGRNFNIDFVQISWELRIGVGGQQLVKYVSHTLRLCIVRRNKTRLIQIVSKPINIVLILFLNLGICLKFSPNKYKCNK